MFGLLKPDLDTLSCEQKSRYQRFYCGLCHGVGTHVGHAWRGVHSYDAIFVAVVADALLEEGAGHDSCRCPMMPLVHKASHDPSSAAMRYAVGVQMLLGDQWLADKAVDGSAVAKVARPLLSKPVQRGAGLLDDLGVDLSELHGFEQVQHGVEQVHPGASEAAEPTARALALVFAAMADLPGAKGSHRDLLADLGRHLGVLIHGLDALEDLVEDAVHGDFNPCLTADGEVDGARTKAVVASVRSSMAGAQSASAALPWLRNADLVTHSVNSLCERATVACERAEEHATPHGLAALRAWVAQPWFMHSAAALLLFLTTVWANLGTSAHAAVDMVAQALPNRRVQQCPCDGCSKCGDGCKDCGDGCKGCGDGCKGCGDGCGNSCNQCSDGCKDCNNCCQGCTSVFAVFS